MQGGNQYSHLINSKPPSNPVIKINNSSRPSEVPQRTSTKKSISFPKQILASLQNLASVIKDPFLNNTEDVCLTQDRQKQPILVSATQFQSKQTSIPLNPDLKHRTVYFFFVKIVRKKLSGEKKIVFGVERKTTIPAIVRMLSHILNVVV
jgi:hypothetical protein